MIIKLFTSLDGAPCKQETDAKIMRRPQTKSGDPAGLCHLKEIQELDSRATHENDNKLETGNSSRFVFTPENDNKNISSPVGEARWGATRRESKGGVPCLA